MAKMWYDHNTKKFHILKTEDVEPYLDANTAERNNGHNGFSKSRNWRHIARIPLSVVEQVWRETGLNLMDNTENSKKYIRRWLEENKKLLTVDKI